MGVRLVQSMPAGDGCIFRESFHNLGSVMDNGGRSIVNVSFLPASQGGGVLAGAGGTARIVYDETGNLGGNQQKMTFVMRYRTATISATADYLISKEPAAVNDNCFIFSLARIAGIVRTYYNIATSAGDTGTYGYYGGIQTDNTEYHHVIVYDGSLAVAQRVQYDVNGTRYTPGASGGTVPTRLRWNAPKLSVFCWSDGNTYGSPGYIFRDLRVYNRAWTNAESVADYQRTMHLTSP